MTGQVPDSGRSAPTEADHSAETSAVTDIVLKRALEIATEAAFLWESRSFVARSSAVTFEALASLDNRLSTVVRALSKRPGLAARLLEHEADSFRSGHVFVTATVALLSGTGAVFEELVKRFESDCALHAALASALSWLAYRDVREYVERLLASPAPTAVRLGISAAVGHGTDPGAPLACALDSEIPLLRMTALEAVGKLGVVRARPQTSAALEDEDDSCRFWAAWSAVRLGDEAGIPVLGRFANQGGPLAAAACEIALRALPPDQAVRTHARLLSVTRNERLGVLAAGIIGDPSLMPWLLERVENVALARAAGAAFCLITGRDLRRDDLDGAYLPAGDASNVPLPVAFETDAESQTRETLDSHSADGDDDLAWPDVMRLRDWWDASHRTFIPGTRYLAGRPVQHGNLAHVMRIGTQQQRAAAALELALLKPAVPLVDVTAPAHQQASRPQQA